MKSISSFWNSLTTADRHAEKRRSSYNPSFTSIRTGLVHTDSSMSINKASPYSSSYDTQSPNASQVNLTAGYPGGLRASAYGGAGSHATNGANKNGGNTGMPMQDFENGVAPPPPVSDSWRRIDHWAEEHYPELFDQLSYGATQADVDELEHDLEMTLPGDVRESLFIHDGQERGGRPTGLFFGIALLDCEELVDEYYLWRKVAASLPRPDEYPMLSRVPGTSGQPAQAGSSNDQAPPSQASAGQGQAQARRTRQQRQGSRPEGACQPVYSHPGWVPLAKDYMGNNIAVDLAPGPQGKWGQIILFGRECDIKYVVAPSWASFLSMFVNDLESPHVVVDEDVGVGGEMGQLKLVLDPNADHSYLETLKARVRRRDRAIRGLQGGHQPSAQQQQQQANGKRNGKERAVSPGKRTESNTATGARLEAERRSTDILLASPVVSDSAQAGVRFNEQGAGGDKTTIKPEQKVEGSLLSPVLPVPASPAVEQTETSPEHALTEGLETVNLDTEPAIVSGGEVEKKEATESAEGKHAEN